MLDESIVNLLVLNKLVDKNKLCMYGFSASTGFGAIGVLATAKDYAIALNGRKVNIIAFNKNRELQFKTLIELDPLQDNTQGFYKKILMGTGAKKYFCISSNKRNFKFMINKEDYDVADAVSWILNGNEQCLIKKYN